MAGSSGLYVLHLGCDLRGEVLGDRVVVEIKVLELDLAHAHLGQPTQVVDDLIGAPGDQAAALGGKPWRLTI